jgi:hypothetical protein
MRRPIRITDPRARLFPQNAGAVGFFPKRLSARSGWASEEQQQARRDCNQLFVSHTDSFRHMDKGGKGQTSQPLGDYFTPRL